MVFETVTQGEAWLDRSAVEASQPKDVAVGSGLASVTFYYPNSERSHFHEIWCGSKRLGNLKHGRRITMKLPAGEYSCRLRKNAPTAVFDLQAGCEYYVRLGFLQAVSSVAGEVTGFTVVPHDVGELEVIDTQAASPKDFREVAEMDLSLLQTNPSKQ